MRPYFWIEDSKSDLEQMKTWVETLSAQVGTVRARVRHLAHKLESPPVGRQTTGIRLEDSAGSEEMSTNWRK